jgi:hypothetical protein
MAASYPASIMSADTSMEAIISQKSAKKVTLACNHTCAAAMARSNEEAAV